MGLYHLSGYTYPNCLSSKTYPTCLSWSPAQSFNSLKLSDRSSYLGPYSLQKILPTNQNISQSWWRITRKSFSAMVAKMLSMWSLFRCFYFGGFYSGTFLPLSFIERCSENMIQIEENHRQQMPSSLSSPKNEPLQNCINFEFFYHQAEALQ